MAKRNVALAQPSANFTLYALYPGERGKVGSAVADQADEAEPRIVRPRCDRDSLRAAGRYLCSERSRRNARTPG